MQQDTDGSYTISKSILQLNCYIIVLMQQNIFVLFAHSATLIYSRVSGLLKLSDWQFLSLFIFMISMSLREHTELKARFQVFFCISRC